MWKSLHFSISFLKIPTALKPVKGFENLFFSEIAKFICLQNLFPHDQTGYLGKSSLILSIDLCQVGQMEEEESEGLGGLHLCRA